MSYGIQYNQTMKRSIFLFVVLLTVFNIFALWNNWYQTSSLADIFAHALFGATVVLFLISFGIRNAGGGRWAVLGLVFVDVLFVGLIWEMIEYLRDYMYAIPYGLPRAQISMIDTIFDLVVNIIGGLAIYLFMSRPTKKKPLHAVLSEVD